MIAPPTPSDVIWGASGIGFWTGATGIPSVTHALWIEELTVITSKAVISIESFVLLDIRSPHHRSLLTVRACEISQLLPVENNVHPVYRFLSRNQKNQRKYTEACRGPRSLCPAVKLPLWIRRSSERGSSRPLLLCRRAASVILPFLVIDEFELYHKTEFKVKTHDGI
jgi:hypothetical protein